MKLVMKLKNHAMSDDTENDRHNVMQPENGSVDWRANKDSWYSSCDQDRQVELGRSCNMYRWSIIVMQIECRTLCVVCEIEHTGCAVSSTVGWLHALASITRLFFWHGKLFFFIVWREDCNRYWAQQLYFAMWCTAPVILCLSHYWSRRK